MHIFQCYLRGLPRPRFVEAVTADSAARKFFRMWAGEPVNPKDTLVLRNGHKVERAVPFEFNSFGEPKRAYSKVKAARKPWWPDIPVVSFNV